MARAQLPSLPFVYASFVIFALAAAVTAPAQAGKKSSAAPAGGRVELDFVADGIVRGSCDDKAGGVFFEVAAVGADAMSLAADEIDDLGAAEADWQGFCARILDIQDGSWLGGLAGDARCGWVWSGLEEPNETYFASLPLSRRLGDAPTTACFRAIHKKLAGRGEVAARLLSSYLTGSLQGEQRPQS